MKYHLEIDLNTSISVGGLLEYILHIEICMVICNNSFDHLELVLCLDSK